MHTKHVVSHESSRLYLASEAAGKNTDMLDKEFFSFQSDNERSERLSIRWKMRLILGGERKERKTFKK